ncbi:hypothetical protein RJ639_004956 [Escallonia herrerae]|uniref:Uncharacterized protein n=1 Tax=Escallonia herrerae TaxID=1293975 RepID=A0AA88W365_9ASTE|nr:hypothetical protein RJ639_004956 [Escallonia herrerae]
MSLGGGGGGGGGWGGGGGRSGRMEKLQQWWRLRFSFRNATIVVCIFNLVTLLLLLQGFLSASYARKLATNHPSSGSSLTLSILIHVGVFLFDPKVVMLRGDDNVRLQYIKESEEIRHVMEPLELIKRVREIEKEARVESLPVQQKDTKQTAAVDLMSRLNNFRSSTDAASLKALEEWRKRKMEREKLRGLGKNGTVTPEA